MMTLWHITPICRLKVRIIPPQVALCRCSELALLKSLLLLLYFSALCPYSSFIILNLASFCRKLKLFINSSCPLYCEKLLSFALSLTLFPVSVSLVASLSSSLSLIRCPCSFLSHSGLSYIMHVKQTDMSESLRCMAVPCITSRGGVRSQRSPCAAQAQLNYSKYTFYRGKINAAPIPESIYTKSLRWKLFII